MKNKNWENQNSEIEFKISAKTEIDMPPKNKTVSISNIVYIKIKIHTCQFQHDAICIILDVGLTSSSSGKLIFVYTLTAD